MTEMFGVPETPTPGSTGSIGGSGYPTAITGNDLSTKDTAKEQARGVAQEGLQGGKRVVSVAADQAKEVVSQTGSQAQALLAEAKSELMEQAASQKSRVVDQLHTLAEEFGSMASKSDQDRLATGLAEQASWRVGAIAHWVSEREPGSLVGELKDFARARPGTFLAVAAGIGLVAGRMTRGVKDGPADEQMASVPASQPDMPEATPSVGLTSQGALPGATGGFAEPLPAGPPLGMGDSYPDIVSGEPLAPRTTGLAP